MTMTTSTRRGCGTGLVVMQTRTFERTCDAARTWSRTPGLLWSPFEDLRLSTLTNIRESPSGGAQLVEPFANGATPPSIGLVFAASYALGMLVA